MDFIANFNKNKVKLLEESIQVLNRKNSGTLGDWLIKWQLKFMKDWIGSSKSDIIFLTTVSDLSQGALFLLFNINIGICKTLGLDFLLPSNIYDWALQNNALSTEFKEGDMVLWRKVEEIDKLEASMITDVDAHKKILHTIEVTNEGVSEKDRSYCWKDNQPDFVIRGAIDMKKVYNSLIGVQ